ncbi:hypothetical protein BJY01DRAFT_209277, partial [Aspergillus pseudoustus]
NEWMDGWMDGWMVAGESQTYQFCNQAHISTSAAKCTSFSSLDDNANTSLISNGGG